MKRVNKHARRYIVAGLVLLGVILISYGFIKYSGNSKNPKTDYSPENSVRINAISAKIVKRKPDSLGQSNFVVADIVIKNNSNNVIGLDPNNCDFSIQLNYQKTYPEAGDGIPCTMIGGVAELKPGKQIRKKTWLHISSAKEGDLVKVTYGYEILHNPGSQGDSQYDYDNSLKATSNPVTIVDD